MKKKQKKGKKASAKNDNHSYLQEGLLWIKFYQFFIKGVYYFYSQEKLYIKKIKGALLGQVISFRQEDSLSRGYHKQALWEYKSSLLTWDVDTKVYFTFSDGKNNA